MTKQEVDTLRIGSGSFNRTFAVNASIKSDVLMHHFIWNRDEVVAVMGPEIKSFTVVRNPYDMFESYYSFVNLENLFGIKIKAFVQLLRENDPMTWRNLNNHSVKENIRIGVYETGISRSLGMPIEIIQDDVAIDKYTVGTRIIWTP